MKRVFLKKIYIKNFGPIIEDEVLFEPFTYFIGRNNAGKSHYLRAVEVLLASKKPDAATIMKLQYDKTQPIEIRGYFEGVQNFTGLVSASNHKQAIDSAISNGILTVVRILDPIEEEKNAFGVLKNDGSIVNPSGFTTNLLKVLPDIISIVATADTIDELKNTANTALSKLKKEVLISFFESLKEKTKTALISLDDFLHSKDGKQRSKELADFEQHLRDELMGEFSEVIPSVKFDLPDEEVIAKEMRVILDDGYPSEIEQKGHGLQRATLLAMLRVLAKHGLRYQDRPTPIFLIGEIETFLHPYAQKLLVEAFDSLIDRYQIIASTHSPFIVSPQTITGYRRVRKHNTEGTKNIVLKDHKNINIDLIKRHLERRGNLEGLFADRIILIEGDHDEGFYEKLQSIFKIPFPPNKFTLFIKGGGKEELRQARKFYMQMGFDDVTIVCDVDYLFSNDVMHLFEELGLDKGIQTSFRKHIDWEDAGDPSLNFVVTKLKEKGEPKDFDKIISELSKHRIFALRKGSPETYCKESDGKKSAWEQLNSREELMDPDYLEQVMKQILR